MMTRTSIFSALLLVALGCQGGGDDKWTAARPKTVPVTGVVTLKGAPVEGAQVNFIPNSTEESAAFAVTKADGTFTLSTFAEEDGAAPAKYKVTITKRSVETKLNPKDPNGPPVGTIEKSFLPDSYGSVETTSLEAEVTEDGKNQFTFDLKE